MIGEFIRDARLRRGLSLEIISMELMISKEKLAAFENNSILPSLKEMQLLSSYIGFKIPPYYETLLRCHTKKRPDL